MYIIYYRINIYIYYRIYIGKYLRLHFQYTNYICILIYRLICLYVYVYIYHIEVSRTLVNRYSNCHIITSEGINPVKKTQIYMAYYRKKNTFKGSTLQRYISIWDQTMHSSNNLWLNLLTFFDRHLIQIRLKKVIISIYHLYNFHVYSNNTFMD